jgi:M6 family metalloprotease-like protein
VVLRGLLVVLGLTVTLAGAGFAVLAAPARSAPEATCTAAEKAARTSAATAYRKRIAAERRAYFRKVADAKRRAAFVKRQRAKLGRLSAAAGCMVLTLPRSSGASCDFMLAQNAEAARLERELGGPFVNVGPITKDTVLPATGQADIVLLFVDFPNAPASEDANAIGTTYTAYTNWFAEASYGRFSVNVTRVPTWFRMPRPAADYGSLYTYAGVDAYMADVIAAADSAVDFSRYDAVWVVAEKDARVLANTAFARFPERGVRADGTEVRFGALMGSARWPGLFHSTVAMHEHLHSMGLPDLGYAGKTLGRWDPMFADDAGTSTTHVLAWHKWLLGWIDASQITCLLQPGQLEETLTPLARPGGKKALVVPTSASTAYVLEVRRKLGYDSAICTEGVLLYTVDSQVRNGEGPIEGKSATTRCAPQATPLAVGQAYEDGAVKVEVLATDGDAYRVRVTRK